MDAATAQISAALTRVASGDRVALEQIYRDTSAKLFGVLLRILSDKSEAEDVLQEVYITVWNKAGVFDPAKASPITWLVAIARNRAIDRLRAGKMRRTSAPIDDAVEISDPSPDAATLLEGDDERRRLTTCLDELDTKTAGAIRSAFLDGFTYEQLAERAGIPLGTMK
ncbi:MAG TPA: sigma-70 family RNA polymerase sigma factor, partial [Xanthobacteraceae bacterium]|nr:sigma-70 family RNA polymerase sigma factor [Xanthobacteraceae bacterium]